MSEEFEYVVEKVKPQRVCFLSTKERGLYDRIVKEDLSRRPYNLERTSAFYKVLNKERSNRGVPPLCNQSPRMGREMGHVPVYVGSHQHIYMCRNSWRWDGSEWLYSDFVLKWEYDNKLGKYKRRIIKFPFGSRIPRWKDKRNNIPGPGTYNPGKKCQTTKMCQTFNGPRKMYPAIETICVTKPEHICERCQEICDGDYWHLDETIYLCSICMIIEHHKNKMFTRKKLEQFKQIRNCSYMHRHEGTSAAVRILPEKLIKLKARKENYLSLFIKPFK